MRRPDCLCVLLPMLVTWPPGRGIGLCWRPDDRFTVAVDYSETDWADAVVKRWPYLVPEPDPENYGEPVLRFENNEPFPYLMSQNDTYTSRIGIEYLFIFGNGTIVPIRGGYFREKQLAAPLELTSFDDVELPGDVYAGYSLGTGLLVKGVQLDLAWVHTSGRTAATTSLGVQEVWFSSDRLLLSAIYLF